MNINYLWIACIITRLCLVLLARNLTRNKNINIASIVLLAIGIGFIYKYLYGSNNEVQIAKVFWHETRIVHGMLYILASHYLYIKNPTMCMILLGLDVLFSILYRIITNQ